MKGIQVNHDTKEIIISADFKKKSEVPMSEEFKYFVEVAQMLPNYAVKSKSNPNAKADNINYSKIDEYIVLKGTDAQKNTYKELRDNKTNFLKVKAWFYSEFPEKKPKKKK